MWLWAVRCLRVSKHTLRQGSHLEKVTFLRRLTLRNLLALIWRCTLRLLRVSNTISDKRKLTFLRHGLGKTVVADIPLDLEISQPFLKVSKHSLSRNLETESKFFRLDVLRGNEGSIPTFSIVLEFRPSCLLHVIMWFGTP